MKYNFYQFFSLVTSSLSYWSAFVVVGFIALFVVLGMIFWRERSSTIDKKIPAKKLDVGYYPRFIRNEGIYK